jgi:hypothetical protein
MTRGHPPYVAIGEAERKAKARGLLVLALEPAGELPFHFVTCIRDCISLVRVRRLKHPGYAVADIEHSCKNDIAALRSMSITRDIVRELWVRGPDRHWYRYLVQPDQLAVIVDQEPDDKDTPGDGSLPSHDGDPVIPFFPSGKNHGCPDCCLNQATVSSSPVLTVYAGA